MRQSRRESPSRSSTRGRCCRSTRRRSSPRSRRRTAASSRTPPTCWRQSAGRSVAMAAEVKVPRLGQGMESGTIVKWLKSEGDAVEKGEPLYELDTDKVTQEVEADASGVLLRIAVQEGEVEVGHTIAVIGQEGEEVPEASADEDGEEGAPQSAEKPARAPKRDDERERGREASAEPDEALQQSVAREDGRGGGRVKASPLARRIARERGIELAALVGT